MTVQEFLDSKNIVTPSKLDQNMWFGLMEEYTNEKGERIDELEALICNAYLNLEQNGELHDDNLDQMKAISDKFI